MNLLFKINCFIFASLLFLPHVGAAKEILLNAVPLTMPQHLMRHYCFMRYKPTVGERYGMLTLMDTKPAKRIKNNYKHEFLCDCGNTHYAAMASVRNGKTKSCGCLKALNEAKVGEKHGRLTLISEKPIPVSYDHVFICDCGNEYVARLADVRNGKTKSCGCIRKVNVYTKESIVEEYLDGFSVSNLCVKYNLCKDTVSKIIKEKALIRNNGSSSQTHSLNVKAFREINPESIYWAGFLAADGCIVDRGENFKVIAISFKKSDKAHIEKFRDFMGSNHPIFDNKNGTIGYSFCSSEVARDLAVFNIFPRKSLTYEPPEFCKESPDFWRGMIDGDGGVYFKYGIFKLFLCGSLGTVSSFVEWVNSFTQNKSNFRKVGNIYSVYINGSNAEKVAQKMYENGGPSLDRKLDVARSYMDSEKCKHLFI